MTVAVSKDNNFASGEIKFSALRDTFRGGGGIIKASELFRNTNNNRRGDIVVPDSTENSDIAGDDYTGEDNSFSGNGNNLSLSTFRDSITYYHLNQTGTDLKLDLDTPDLWNSNLSKNILKKINVNGTIYSDDSTIPALQIGGAAGGLPGGDIKIRNLTVHAYDGGKILGYGGKGGTHMNWWKPDVVPDWTANDANFSGGPNQPNQSGMNTYAIYAKPVNTVNFGVHTFEGTLTIPTTGNYYFKWAVDDVGTLTFNGTTTSHSSFTSPKTETYSNLAAGTYDIKFTVTNSDQSPVGNPNNFANNPGGIGVRLYNDANETIWSTLDLLNTNNIGRGEDGGTALWAASYNVDDTPVSRWIDVQADTGSQIYGGGGGGGAGYSGGTGGQGGGVVGANGGQPGAGGKGGLGGDGAGYNQPSEDGESGYAGGQGEVGDTKQYMVSEEDDSGVRTFHGGVGGNGGDGGDGGKGGNWGEDGVNGSSNGRKKGNNGGKTEPDAFLFKVPHRPFTGMTMSFTILNKRNIGNYKGASYAGRGDAVTDANGTVIGYKSLYYWDGTNEDANGSIFIMNDLDNPEGRTIAPNVRFTTDGWGVTADGPGWFRLLYSWDDDSGDADVHFRSVIVHGQTSDTTLTRSGEKGTTDEDIEYNPNVVDGNLLTFFLSRAASHNLAVTIGGDYTGSGNPPWNPLTNSLYSGEPAETGTYYVGYVQHYNSPSWEDTKLVYGPVWFYDKSAGNSKRKFYIGSGSGLSLPTWRYNDDHSSTDYTDIELTPVVMDDTDAAGNNISDLMYQGNVQGDKGEGRQGGLPLPDDGGDGGTGGRSINGWYFRLTDGSDSNSIKGEYLDT